MRNNSVYRVLVTKGNQAVLAADKTVDELIPGQIGVFNSETNKSIDGTKPVREVYLAVGVDKDDDGVIDGITTSAGGMGGSFPVRGISHIMFRPHTPEQPQIVEVSNIRAKCEQTYALRIGFHNQQIYRTQGYVPFTKCFVVETGVCKACTSGCGTYDSNLLVKSLINQINEDKDNLIKAVALQPDGTEITDLDAFIEQNKATNTDDDESNDVIAKIRITTIPLRKNYNKVINQKYYGNRVTTIDVYPSEGFDLTTKVEVVQEAVAEEGSGYDVREREFKAGGWTGQPGPYRTSVVTGLPMGDFDFFAEEKENYDLINLGYVDTALNGWLEYNNDMFTEIAVPQGDTTTRDSLIGVLDKLSEVQGFSPLADDAATANTDPNTVEKTSEKDDYELDGMGAE